MKKTKRIPAGQLPIYWPIQLSLICWLLMDRFAIPKFWCGVIWTLVALLWILYACAIFSTEYVSIKFPNE